MRERPPAAGGRRSPRCLLAAACGRLALRGGGLRRRFHRDPLRSFTRYCYALAWEESNDRCYVSSLAPLMAGASGRVATPIPLGARFKLPRFRAWKRPPRRTFHQGSTHLISSIHQARALGCQTCAWPSRDSRRLPRGLGHSDGQRVAPPEGEMPKINGPFWVVLVFVYSKGAVVRT